VNDDLGIGLGDEVDTAGFQPGAQVEEVLDDAVVHEHDAAG